MLVGVLGLHEVQLAVGFVGRHHLVASETWRKDQTGGAEARLGPRRPRPGFDGYLPSRVAASFLERDLIGLSDRDERGDVDHRPRTELDLEPLPVATFQPDHRPRRQSESPRVEIDESGAHRACRLGARRCPVRSAGPAARSRSAWRGSAARSRSAWRGSAAHSRSVCRSGRRPRSRSAWLAGRRRARGRLAQAGTTANRERNPVSSVT